VNLFEELLNIVMPTRCIWCGQIGSVLCEACFTEIKKPVRQVSRLEISGYAVNAYSEKIAILIHEFKENQQLSLANNMAAVMWPGLQNFDLDKVLLVPMPSKKASFANRGFNPAEELAKRISRQAARGTTIRVSVSKCLKITGPVSDQAALSGEARRTNLDGTMSLAGFPAGHSAILIDDVVTTGATLREAERCLAKAGVKVQGFLAFAETPPRNVRKRYEKLL
jgi:ComF family protein